MLTVVIIKTTHTNDTSSSIDDHNSTINSNTNNNRLRIRLLREGRQGDLGELHVILYNVLLYYSIVY